MTLTSYSSFCYHLTSCFSYECKIFQNLNLIHQILSLITFYHKISWKSIDRVSIHGHCQLALFPPLVEHFKTVWRPLNMNQMDLQLWKIVDSVTVSLFANKYFWTPDLANSTNSTNSTIRYRTQKQIWLWDELAGLENSECQLVKFSPVKVQVRCLQVGIHYSLL